MTRNQRAAQLWSLLALTATNRQVLTYEMVARLIGVPRAGLGPLLDPIHQYCLSHDLPPLTVVVVSEQSGTPGAGFSAAEDIPRAQIQVFAHDWLGERVPGESDFS